VEEWGKVCCWRSESSVSMARSEENDGRNTGTSAGSQQTGEDNTDRAKPYVTGEKQKEKKRKGDSEKQKYKINE